MASRKPNNEPSRRGASRAVAPRAATKARGAVVRTKPAGAAPTKSRAVVASARPAGKHATLVGEGKPIAAKRAAIVVKQRKERAGGAPSGAKPKLRAADAASRAHTRASAPTKPGRAAEPADPRSVFAKLRQYHADAHCELDHRSPFELIVATVLSAQSTDVTVNQVTPELFRRWPTPAALAQANPGEVERTILRTGFFRQKTKSIMGLSARLVAEHGGEVPRTLAELVKLPGVGRKTANVVLGVAFGTPEGVVVDTHVQRLSQRLGWTKHQDPIDIEQDLMREFPREDWDALGHVLIFHGRRICTARKPACASCPVAVHCPCAFKAENVGRKPARTRA